MGLGNRLIYAYFLVPNAYTVSGNIEIAVKQSSKDLGCMMHYTRRVTLGCLKTRMAAAATGLYRLSKLHLTIPEKAAKIQAAIWPVAFYRAESQVIGGSHFVKLRRLACDALVGKHKFASSWIALHFLTDRVSDKLLYVILTALCSFRRLFFYHYDLAQDMWSSVMTSSSVTGCGALAAYLRKVNWVPLPDGLIETPCGYRVDLQVQSTLLLRSAIHCGMLGLPMYGPK